MNNVFGSKTNCRDQLLKMESLEDSEIYENVYEICKKIKRINGNIKKTCENINKIHENTYFRRADFQ